MSGHLIQVGWAHILLQKTKLTQWEVNQYLYMVEEKVGMGQNVLSCQTGLYLAMLVNILDSSMVVIKKQESGITRHKENRS